MRTMKRLFVVLLAMTLLLTGCAFLDKEEKETIAVVNTVDELLSAIAPGARIQLGEGEFCLSEASDYGERKGPYYVWNDLGLGEYGLQIQYVEGLTIYGSGKDKTRITTDPRFANVLSFVDCRDVSISDLTVGHTVRTEACGGGVIYLNHSSGISFKSLGLYGCGTDGVSVYECEDVTVKKCQIYDCSVSGINISDSRNVTVSETEIHSLGDSLPVYACFNLWGECSSVTIEGCTIRENYVENLIYSTSQGSVKFRDNAFAGNKVSSGAFSLQNENILFENNTFEDNACRTWYVSGSARALGPDGKPVPFVDAVPETVEPGVAEPVSTGDQRTYRVKTANQFLKAIGPDTKIIIESALIDLSLARDYGMGSSEYYYWEETYDGPSLVIRNVNNLTITTATGDRATHTISAAPRYAQVLTFESCSAVTLSGFTAGHTVEPGECMGGVLLLRSCRDLLVENCGLYGCGILGVQTQTCENLQIINSEIYECSYGGIWLQDSSNVRISGTTFRDLGGVTYSLNNCRNVIAEGEELDGNYSGD